MADFTSVGEGSFQAEVLESEVPVLVDFGAVWCGPCRMLDPVVKQLASEWTGKVKIVKLDVDDSPDLAAQYQVLGVPTLMLFVGGRPIERLSGYQPKDRVAAKFSPHI